MRSVFTKKVVFAGGFTFAACVLLASFVPSSVSAPGAAAFAAESTISPLAMMAQAPRDLPIEHYGAH